MFQIVGFQCQITCQGAYASVCTSRRQLMLGFHRIACTANQFPIPIPDLDGWRREDIYSYVFSCIANQFPIPIPDLDGRRIGNIYSFMKKMFSPCIAYQSPIPHKSWNKFNLFRCHWPVPDHCDVFFYREHEFSDRGCRWREKCTLWQSNQSNNCFTSVFSPCTFTKL